MYVLNTKEVHQNGKTKIVNTGIVWKDYSVSLKKIHKHNQNIIWNIVF